MKEYFDNVEQLEEKFGNTEHSDIMFVLEEFKNGRWCQIYADNDLDSTVWSYNYYTESYGSQLRFCVKSKAEYFNAMTGHIRKPKSKTEHADIQLVNRIYMKLHRHSHDSDSRFDELHKKISTGSNNESELREFARLYSLRLCDKLLFAYCEPTSCGDFSTAYECKQFTTNDIKEIIDLFNKLNEFELA